MNITTKKNNTARKGGTSVFLFDILKVFKIRARDVRTRPRSVIILLSNKQIGTFRFSKNLAKSETPRQLYEKIETTR